MIEINFKPEGNDPIVLEATNEYHTIFAAHKQEITKAFEKFCGYSFPVTELEAMVHTKISQSHPLKFDASRDKDRKLGDVIHELGHIAIVDGPTKRFVSVGDDENTRSHKMLDLILFDVLLAVRGETFAIEQVISERQQSSAYKAAWDWALAMDEGERQAEFRKFLI